MGHPPSVIRSMPAQDFDLLRRYGEQEPFGPWRHNHDIAVMASALFNLHRGKNDPRSPEAFMYKPPEVYASEQVAQAQQRVERTYDFLRVAAKPASGRRRRAPSVILE